MFFPASGWFAAFVLTLAIEAPIAVVLLRQAEPDLRRLGVLIVFANLASHPVVWYVISQLVLVGTPDLHARRRDVGDRCGERLLLGGDPRSDGATRDRGRGRCERHVLVRRTSYQWNSGRTCSR